MGVAPVWRVPEVISELDYRVVDQEGREYFVNVAADAIGGRWEGWLEFIPLDDSEPLLTRTETHQSTRNDIAHWGSGLTQTFVQGAFDRASSATAGEPRKAATPLPPPEPLTANSLQIDPFAIFVTDPDALQLQLKSLTRAELLTIIDVHGLNPAELSLARLSVSQLVTFIVTAIQVQLRQGLKRPAE